MKKTSVIILSIIILLIISVFSFGIQIGNIRIGKQIDLQTRQDSNFENSDFNINYYSKNELTVLNLWATWCKPCVEEIPLLNTIQKENINSDIHFLSLSVDKDSVKLVNFLSKDKFLFKDITLDNLKYRNAILNTLEGKKTDEWISTQSVPVTYLIRNKKVVAKIDGTIDKNDLVYLINKHK